MNSPAINYIYALQSELVINSNKVLDWFEVMLGTDRIYKKGLCVIGVNITNFVSIELSFEFWEKNNELCVSLCIKGDSTGPIFESLVLKGISKERADRILLVMDLEEDKALLDKIIRIIENPELSLGEDF